MVVELSSGGSCPALPNNDCSAIAGADGTYAIFNLPAGTYNVKAFVVGSNYAPVPVGLPNGQAMTGVNLSISGTANAKLEGNLSYVNAGSNETTVTLAVKSTVNRLDSALVTGVPVMIRGQMPPGFRDADAGNTFSIPGVPDGEYVILTSFENDGLVRDPDICITGTDILEITSANGQITSSGDLDGPLKVTGALEVISPSANQAVSSTPTFTWEDDSSGESYEIIVYDSFGVKVWDAEIEGVNGGNTVSVTYGSTGSNVLRTVLPALPLEPGTFYQFHIISLKPATSQQCSSVSALTGISQTEDLKRVFQVQ